MQPCITQTEPKFDKKYKVIVRLKYTDQYFETLDWINTHSIGSVEVKISDADRDIYYAFSNPDDALVFKVRYRV